MEADGADVIVGRRGNEVVHRGARGQRGRRTYCSNFATGCDCFWVGLECEGGGHEDRREGKGRQMLALGSTGLGCEGSAIVDAEERTTVEGGTAVKGSRVDGMTGDDEEESMEGGTDICSCMRACDGLHMVRDCVRAGMIAGRTAPWRGSRGT